MNSDQPIRDLWGDLNLNLDPQRQIEDDWPQTLLDEQANLLGKKTNNRLSASAEIRTFQGGRAWRFFLIAPALDDYRYELFRIEQGFAHAEMLRIFGLDLHDPPKDIPSSELEDHIQQILRSPSTKAVISSLLQEIRQRQADDAEQG